MKYYIIAGEASGDLHASNLIKEIKKLDASATFRGWGGDLMEEQGCELVKHYKDIAFMGFTEVILHLRTILRNIRFCKTDLMKHIPDAVIFVDYPGFNLRIAKFAKHIGFKTFYYISPQVWAWKQSRISILRNYVDRLFVILPFEKDFFTKHNYNVDFVGHPLLDVIADTSIKQPDFLQKNNLDDREIIALLPGSRKQEIMAVLPVMLGVVHHYPNKQFVIAGVNANGPEFYEQLLQQIPVKVIFNQTYQLLTHAQAACVTSGTAALETALFNVPEVVCYRGSNISYQIAKRLIGKNIKYISLVNLIMDAPVLKELIQDELTADNLQNELDKLLINTERRKQLMKDYCSLRNKLGGEGASHKTAKLIVEAVS